MLDIYLKFVKVCEHKTKSRKKLIWYIFFKVPSCIIKLNINLLKIFTYNILHLLIIKKKN